MTVSGTTSRFSSAGNGVTTDFSFNQKFYSESDIKVVSRVTATGVETPSTLNVGHTIVSKVSDGNGGYSSATVRMASAPATGSTLTRYLDPALTQEADFQSETNVLDALNRKADLIELKLQRLSDRAARSPILSEAASSVSFDGTIEGAVTAGYAVIVNGDGDGFTLGTPAAGATVGAALVSFLASASKAAAVAELGLPAYYAAVYGVVADGVTDNTAALNALYILVAAAGGGVIYYPAGTVLSTGQLSYTGSHVVHRGQGRLLTLFKNTYTSGAAFLCGSTSVQSLEHIFEDMCIVGTGSQIFFHQRYLRGLRFRRCSGSSLSQFIKIGDTGASGAAYVTEIDDCELGGVTPTIVKTGGSGTFTAGETITGGSSGATAKVLAYSTPTLSLYSLSSTAFTVGETITGGSSGATGTISTFSRAGKNFIDVFNGSGALLIYNSQIEGSYDGAQNGVEFSNNINATFDQFETRGCYLARFNRNINAVDVRLGNVSISDNRLDEALVYGLNFEVTSSTSKAIGAVGFAGAFSDNTIGSGTVPGKGIRFANARSTAGQDSGNLTISNLMGQAVSGPLLMLKTSGNGVLRDTQITGVHAKEHTAGTDVVEIDIANASDLPGFFLEDVSSRTGRHLITFPTASPDATALIGNDLMFGSAMSGSKINGAPVRRGDVVSSSIASGSAVSLTNNTLANIATISLTPGDWDITATITMSPNGATTQSRFTGSIHTANNAHASPPDSAYAVLAGSFGAGEAISVNVGTKRVSITATTSYYLNVTSAFAVNTNAAYGILTARRAQ